jgi:hypothetical protein
LRCYDFPSRLSGRLFASLSGVHAILLGSCLAACAPGRSEGPSGPGSLFNRRPELPVYSHVDVNGTSQVSRRSILCLCPALRPRPNRRSLAYPTVSSMLPPHFPRRRLQRLMNFGALSRGFGTCCLRFTNGVVTVHAKLASGWLARLYREGVEPSGSLQKVSDHPSSFSGLSLAQGKFHETSLRLHDCRALVSRSLTRAPPLLASKKQHRLRGDAGISRALCRDWLRNLNRSTSAGNPVPRAPCVPPAQSAR